MAPQENTEPSPLADAFAAVYQQLRNFAARKMENEPAQTIGPTALVHEVFMQLEKEEDCNKWKDKRLFFAAAGEAMRRILLERARARRRLKRGGGLSPAELSICQIESPEEDERVIALDEALNILEADDAHGAELIKLKYFIGLSWEEIAAIHETTTRTLRRRWSYARVRLREILENDFIQDQP